MPRMVQNQVVPRAARCLVHGTDDARPDDKLGWPGQSAPMLGLTARTVSAARTGPLISWCRALHRRQRQVSLPTNTRSVQTHAKTVRGWYRLEHWQSARRGRPERQIRS